MTTPLTYGVTPGVSFIHSTNINRASSVRPALCWEHSDDQHIIYVPVPVELTIKDLIEKSHK